MPLYYTEHIDLWSAPSVRGWGLGPSIFSSRVSLSCVINGMTVRGLLLYYKACMVFLFFIFFLQVRRSYGCRRLVAAAEIYFFALYTIDILRDSAWTLHTWMASLGLKSSKYLGTYRFSPREKQRSVHALALRTSSPCLRFRCQIKHRLLVPLLTLLLLLRQVTLMDFLDLLEATLCIFGACPLPFFHSAMATSTFFWISWRNSALKPTRKRAW